MTFNTAVLRFNRTAPVAVGTLLLLAALFVLTPIRTAHATALMWVGTTGDWNTPSNWNPPQVPLAGDSVDFPGTATIKAVTGINASVASFTVTADGYTFGGTSLTVSSGVITVNTAVTTPPDIQIPLAQGATGIDKQGDGTLHLSGISSYTGPTHVSAGILSVAATALPTATAVTLAGTGKLSLNGGAVTIGSLASPDSGTQVLTGTLTPPGATLTVGNASDTVFNGGITGANGMVVKQGTGKLSLSGVNTYTGSTTVNGGTLYLNGTEATSGVTVSAAHVSAGTATTTGIANLTAGSLNLAPAATFDVRLNGTTAGSGYDQFHAGGTVTLGGATLNAVATFTYAIGDAVNIITSTSLPSGTFAGLPENTVTTISGQTFRINYTATGVTLTRAVSGVATTTTLVSSKNPSNQGESVTFTATVAGTPGTPTGTVQFKDGTTNLGTPVPVDGAGHAAYTTAALAPGTHAITAAYSGDTTFASSTSNVVNQVVNASGTPGGNYTAVPPARILDTRTGSKLGPSQSIDVVVAGAGGVPATGVAAASINVTVVNGSASSYLTLFPTGQQRPTASNVNFLPGQQIANLTMVTLGTGGKVTVYNDQGSVDVIFDVQGWVASSDTGAAGRFNPMPVPTRVLDTRTGVGAPVGRIGAGQVVTVQITGSAPRPTKASGAVLNVTAVNGSAASYLTVYPAGASTRPEASNVNFPAGKNVPNRVMVQLSADGKVSIYNSEGDVDIVADLAGSFTDTTGTGGALYHALSPARILDTRPNSPVGPNSVISVQVAGQGGVPATGATGLVANVTAADATSATFITVYPDGNTTPLASDLNPTMNETVPNLVVVGLGSNGKIAIYNNLGSVQVIVDVAGYFG